MFQNEQKKHCFPLSNILFNIFDLFFIQDARQFCAADYISLEADIGSSKVIDCAKWEVAVLG